MAYINLDENDIRTCWCPCGCGIKDGAGWGQILDNGLCDCCAAGVSHEVAPPSCRPSLKQLIHQHQSIINFLTHLDNLCDNCGGEGEIPKNTMSIENTPCPNCHGPAEFFKNKDGLALRNLCEMSSKEIAILYGG